MYAGVHGKNQVSKQRFDEKFKNKDKVRDSLDVFHGHPIGETVPVKGVLMQFDPFAAEASEPKSRNVKFAGKKPPKRGSSKKPKLIPALMPMLSFMQPVLQPIGATIPRHRQVVPMMQKIPQRVPRMPKIISKIPMQPKRHQPGPIIKQIPSPLKLRANRPIRRHRVPITHPEHPDNVPPPETVPTLLPIARGNSPGQLGGPPLVPLGPPRPQRPGPRGWPSFGTIQRPMIPQISSIQQMFQRPRQQMGSIYQQMIQRPRPVQSPFMWVLVRRPEAMMPRQRPMIPMMQNRPQIGSMQTLNGPPLVPLGPQRPQMGSIQSQMFQQSPNRFPALKPQMFSRPIRPQMFSSGPQMGSNQPQMLSRPSPMFPTRPQMGSLQQMFAKATGQQLNPLISSLFNRQGPARTQRMPMGSARNIQLESINPSNSKILKPQYGSSQEEYPDEKKLYDHEGYYSHLEDEVLDEDEVQDEDVVLEEDGNLDEDSVLEEDGYLDEDADLDEDEVLDEDHHDDEFYHDRDTDLESTALESDFEYDDNDEDVVGSEQLVG